MGEHKNTARPRGTDSAIEVSATEAKAEDEIHDGGEDPAKDRTTGADSRGNNHDVAVTLALIFVGSVLLSFFTQLGVRLLLRYLLLPA